MRTSKSSVASSKHEPRSSIVTSEFYAGWSVCAACRAGGATADIVVGPSGMAEMGAELRRKGNEFGATTGRPRRCGWFDAVATRYAAMLNGVDEVASLFA